MSGGKQRVVCGYIPLTDAATLIVAEEMGFAAEEGVTLDLVRETSWSNIRDKLAMGLFDAAHMLAPMPIAMAMGLSAHPADVSVPMLLSVNGNMVGVGGDLGDRLRRVAGVSVFDDAAAAAEALRRASGGRPLRVGVPWLFSMHAILLEYWLGRSGFALGRDVTLTVVPPPFMAEALGAGEIDMFCVGEPWGSIAVEDGAGAILLSMAAVWRFAPEKALGVSSTLRDERPETLDALVRALHRAGMWAADPHHRGAVADMLSREDRLGRPAEVIERALGGVVIANAAGQVHRIPDALYLFERWAQFPWVSQQVWITERLADRHGLPPGASPDRPVFRPDLYRRALAPVGADLPAASSKLEGGLSAGLDVRSTLGFGRLGPDAFFDGAVFDPGR